jgi:hypothetical protein
MKEREGELWGKVFVRRRPSKKAKEKKKEKKPEFFLFFSLLLPSLTCQVQRSEERPDPGDQPPQPRPRRVRPVLLDPPVQLRHHLRRRVRRVHRTHEVDQSVLLLQMPLAPQDTCVGGRAGAGSQHVRLGGVEEVGPVVGGGGGLGGVVFVVVKVVEVGEVGEGGSGG